MEDLNNQQELVKSFENINSSTHQSEQECPEQRCKVQSDHTGLEQTNEPQCEQNLDQSQKEKKQSDTTVKHETMTGDSDDLDHSQHLQTIKHEQLLQQQEKQQQHSVQQQQDNPQNQVLSQSLSEKTPISTLQEMCTRQGITPQYDLVANEGAVHEPLFVFKVTVGEYISTGKGPSKKKAKHNAAVACLQQMLGSAGAATALGTANSASSFNPTAPSPALDENLAGNPVGELQEITQKRMWQPPVYDFASEQGPPHAREFICLVRLFDIAEKGVGKSKKLAKRNAAIAMLQLIKQGLINPKGCGNGNQLDDYDNEDSSGMNEGSGGIAAGSGSAGMDLRNGPIGTNIVTERKKISAMFQTSGKASKSRGKLIESLQGLSLEEDKIRGEEERRGVGEMQLEVVGGEESYCRALLEDLAKEQKFETNYIDLDSNVSNSANPGTFNSSAKTHSYLCMLRLTTVPVTVCHGSGCDRLRAREVAALNALSYLKVMTRRS